MKSQTFPGTRRFLAAFSRILGLLFFGLASPCFGNAEAALHSAFGTTVGATLPRELVKDGETGTALLFVPTSPNPAFSRYFAHVTPTSRLVYAVRGESETTTSCTARFAHLRLAVERDYPALAMSRSLNGQIAVYDEPGTARYIEIGCDDRQSSARFWIEYGDRDLEALGRKEQEAIEAELFPREGL